MPTISEESVATRDNALSGDSKNNAPAKELQLVQRHYEFQEYHLQKEVEKIMELKNEHKFILEQLQRSVAYVKLHQLRCS